MARTISAENRKAIAKAQKKRWKAWRAAQQAPDAVAVEPIPAVTSNGHPRVDQRIVVLVADYEIPLTVEDARHLRDALSQALPTP
jgi:hypothetical protein